MCALSAVWALLGTLASLFTSTATAQSEHYFEARYCEGMRTQVALTEDDAKDTVADCLSSTHIIEVDFTHRWQNAVGQALFYAAQAEATSIGKRRPGIIFVCLRKRDTCTDHVVRAFRTFQHYAISATIWDCDPENSTLAACQRIESN